MNKGTFKRGNNGAFDTDLEEARIAEANARHDAEMKRLGRGFLQQTQNAMGKGISAGEMEADTLRIAAQGRTYRTKKAKVNPDWVNAKK